jgi:hypothetical protein
MSVNENYPVILWRNTVVPVQKASNRRLKWSLMGPPWFDYPWYL